MRAGFGTYYALLDNLSYRLDQNGPFNTVVRRKKHSRFRRIAPDATYTGAKVIPSGVQPDLRTPTVESWSLKVEQQIANEHVGERGLHRLARISRVAFRRTPIFRRRRSARRRRARLPYPSGTLYYPANAPLAEQRRVEYHALVFAGHQFVPRA